MAIYTHLEVDVPSGARWLDVLNRGNRQFFDSTLIVLLNSDGTDTRISGSGFTFDINGNGGTIKVLRGAGVDANLTAAGLVD